jgi:hypothetical protein
LGRGDEGTHQGAKRTKPIRAEQSEPNPIAQNELNQTQRRMAKKKIEPERGYVECVKTNPSAASSDEDACLLIPCFNRSGRVETRFVARLSEAAFAEASAAPAQFGPSKL